MLGVLSSAFGGRTHKSEHKYCDKASISFELRTSPIYRPETRTSALWMAEMGQMALN